jgi:hypothetical protein
LNPVYILTAILGAVLAVATVAGTFFAFKTSRTTQLIGVYKGTAEAWEQRAAAHAEEIKELQNQNQDQGRQIADLQGQVTMLKEMVTGHEMLEELLARTSQIQQLLESGQNGGPRARTTRS